MQNDYTTAVIVVNYKRDKKDAKAKFYIFNELKTIFMEIIPFVKMIFSNIIFRSFNMTVKIIVKNQLRKKSCFKGQAILL